VTHSEAFTGLRLQYPLASVVAGKQARPFVLAAADGGNGYWHVHGHDNPLAMLHDEFLPLLAARGLDCAPGRPPATFGWSMGGYGSLLYGETYPGDVAAVTADGPAIWLSWPQARAANSTAFTSAVDFSDHDVITHSRRLSGIPVQVRGGISDPFAPSTVVLQRAIGSSRVILSKGCHTSPFMLAAAPLLLAFAGSHLA
jgi:pimeloyl-ACP methyl ester carboxylesterase